VVVDFSLDFRVLGFALALSFVTGILLWLDKRRNRKRLQ